VEMHTRTAKVQHRHWRIFAYPAKLLLCFVGFADCKNGVAYHLRAQSGFLSEAGVHTLMQRYAVPATMLNDSRNEPVAGSDIGSLQCPQQGRLVRRRIEFDCGSTLHLVSPLSVFRSLNISLDFFRTDLPCHPHVV